MVDARPTAAVAAVRAGAPLGTHRARSAAAVGVALITVGDPVVTHRIRAAPIGAADALNAVCGHSALIADVARTARGATAVHVGLDGVLHPVDALGPHAATATANAADAVLILSAGLGIPAGWAHATAVNVGLIAVLHRVDARRRRADPLRADAGLAILGAGARLAIVTHAAVAAPAIHVGLDRVVHTIAASRQSAACLVANPACAVRILLTGRQP